MTRIQGTWRRIFHLAIAFIVIGFLSAFDFKPGQLITTEEGQSYRFERHLGAGDFGSVWEVANTKTGRRYAIKFYEATDKTKLKGNRSIHNIKPVRNRSNLLNVYEVGKFQSEDGRWHDGVRTEVGRGSLESAIGKSFSLRGVTDYHDVTERVLNAHHLMQDLLSASDQLSQSGLTHHDINPRNVQWFFTEGNERGRFKVADFDGVTISGKNPPPGAYEYAFGSLEYEADRLRGKYAGLSDVQTIAHTIFYSLFGMTPIEKYALFRRPHSSRENPALGLSMTRALLWRFKVNRLEYEKMIRSFLEEEGKKIPAEGQEKFQVLSRFLIAATKVDPGERQKELHAIFPQLEAAKKEVKGTPGVLTREEIATKELREKLASTGPIEEVHQSILVHLKSLGKRDIEASLWESILERYKKHLTGVIDPELQRLRAKEVLSLAQIMRHTAKKQRVIQLLHDNLPDGVLKRKLALIDEMLTSYRRKRGLRDEGTRLKLSLIDLALDTSGRRDLEQSAKVLQREHLEYYAEGPSFPLLVELIGTPAQSVEALSKNVREMEQGLSQENERLSRLRSAQTRDRLILGNLLTLPFLSHMFGVAELPNLLEAPPILYSLPLFAIGLHEFYRGYLISRDYLKGEGAERIRRFAPELFHLILDIQSEQAGIEMARKVVPSSSICHQVFSH